MYEHLFGTKQATNKTAIPDDWQYRVERVLPFVYDSLTDQEKFLFDNWFVEEKMEWTEIAEKLGVKRGRIDAIARAIRGKFHAPIPEWIYKLPANEVITDDQYGKIKTGKMKLHLLGLTQAQIKTLNAHGIRNIDQLRNASDTFLSSLSGIGAFTLMKYKEAIAYWDSLNDYILDALSHPSTPMDGEDEKEL